MHTTRTMGKRARIETRQARDFDDATREMNAHLVDFAQSVRELLHLARVQQLLFSIDEEVRLR